MALTTLAPWLLRTGSDAGDHVLPVFTNGSEGGFDPGRGSLCDTLLNVSVATPPHDPALDWQQRLVRPGIPSAGVC